MSIFHDLRQAARSLRRSPGFTALAVLTLGLGLGAAAAIASVVDGVLLRPLPYPESDRLVVVQETLPPRMPELAVSRDHYFEWVAQAHSFARIAAMHEGSYNLTGMGEPVRVSAGRLTANTLATLGVRPALGRDFASTEDTPRRGQVVILSHGFWVRQLGGRADVLGRTLQLDGEPHTVVGVMPGGFQLDGPLDLFTPAGYEPGGVHDIGAIGRLAPGVSLAQARSEMELISARRAEPPIMGVKLGVKLTPLLEKKVHAVRPLLVAVLGAVGFLLLIACANVANLLLARGTVRARELAVRAALGASRARIARQLLLESVLLAGLGAVAGAIVGQWGVSALLAAAPDTLPRAQELALDPRALIITGALVLLTAIGFGLLPALRAAGTAPGQTLKNGGPGAGDRGGALRAGLVAAEVAIALVLLVGAGLLMRSFVHLQRLSPGFDPHGATGLTLALPPKKYPAGPQQALFARQAVAALAKVPGVAAAGVAQGLQLEGNFDWFFAEVVGRPSADPPLVNGFLVDGDYFRAMGITLRRGRLLDGRDRRDGPLVTVISGSMARRLFGDGDPLGQRIRARGSALRFEVVGVVGDVTHDRLAREPTLQAYAPLPQGAADWGVFTFVVRGRASPAALRAAIATVDAGQAVTSIRPLADWQAGTLARERFALLLFGVFSGAALLLAAIGLYGVMSYTVGRRRAEIGIRMALGARAGQVLALVLRQGARLVALGMAAGLAGALALSRLLSSLLYGVSATDPLTFAGIALLLALTAVLACLLPARRAARIDPLTALRTP
jgi:putative ABC transport system permease protein